MASPSLKSSLMECTASRPAHAALIARKSVAILLCVCVCLYMCVRVSVCVCVDRRRNICLISLPTGNRARPFFTGDDDSLSDNDIGMPSP